jgi:hypothetical protein
MHFTNRELEVIAAALAAVSPSGGGSETFHLSQKVMGQVKDWSNDRHNGLVADYTKNVIRDAVEAGAVTAHFDV